MGTITYTDTDGRVLRRSHDPSVTGNVVVKEHTVGTGQSAQAHQGVPRNADGLALRAFDVESDSFLRPGPADGYEISYFADLVHPTTPSYYGTVNLGGPPEPKVDQASCVHRLVRRADNYECSACLFKVTEQSLRALSAFDPYKTHNAKLLPDATGELQEQYNTAMRELAVLQRDNANLRRKLGPPAKPEPLVGSTWKRRPI